MIWRTEQGRSNRGLMPVLVSDSSVLRNEAHFSAAYESLRTVGNLLLTNSDFRLFLGDVHVVGRQVFADTAFSLSEVAEDAGKKLEPSSEAHKTISAPGADDQGTRPTAEDITNEATEVANIVGDGLAKTGHDALNSLQNNVSGDQKETLLFRLKQTVLKLRKRNDYSDSVSTIGTLIQRYAKAYSRAADETISTAQEDISTNNELDRAVKNFWSLLTSFGDRQQWDSLEQKMNKVMEHSKKDPQFEELMMDVGTSVQKMLTDPDFFDSANTKIQELREKSKEAASGSSSSVREDIDDLLVQAKTTLQSVLEDQDVSKLLATSTKIFNIISPLNAVTNTDLIEDSIHFFIPLLVNAIQYVPIPRVEVSVPELDLLLENFIVEPGSTINHTSFFPYKLRLETINNVEVRKAKHRTATTASSLVTIKIDGISFRAEEIGFWLRAHTGLLWLADEGIASVALDERGLDIHLDVEIGREPLEHMLTLRDVRVHVHKLTYQLRQSKFSWLAWLMGPLVRPILRRVLESQVASAISDALHAANRELVFARERLRATRIADPQDLSTFVRAVLARLTPPDDPDVYAAVGVTPSKGVFRGVYAPGSLVKLWEEEGRRAAERVDDFQIEGWRNEIFDVQAVMMGQ